MSERRIRMARALAGLALLCLGALPAVGQEATTAPAAAAQAPAAAAPAAPAATPAATPAPATTVNKDGDEVDVDTDSSKTSKDPTQAQKMLEAVRELMAEARELEKITENIKIQPHFTRPHPALGAWGPEMALPTLRRMLGTFTGNDYRDTYIRWHLMHVAKMIRESDKRGNGQMLVDLVKRMPAELGTKERQEYRDEPPEIAAKYHQLVGGSVVVVGYPPFQKHIGPPASLNYMDAARRKQVEANLAEAAKLRDKWKRIVDKDAVAFNRRLRSVNWCIRQYRGELIYSIIDTGEPAMLKLVTDSIGGHVQKKSGIAYDLMAFLYLATFDGVLEKYDQKTLNSVSGELERIARANEGYVRYEGRDRNFADYAFHIIHMLKDLEGVSGSTEDVSAEEGK